MSFADYVRVMNDIYSLEVLHVALEELEERYENKLITFAEYSNDYITISQDIVNMYSKYHCPTSIELL